MSSVSRSFRFLLVKRNNLRHSIDIKTIAQNRRATYDYEIITTVTAGIQLTGQEVKSCRNGHINLAGAYVSLLSGKPILKQSTIAPYANAHNIEGYDPKQDRLLLLKQTEIKKLQATMQEKGVSLVPLKVLAGKYIKVELGLGKGKKRIDKRNIIKNRDVDRKIRSGKDY